MAHQWKFFRAGGFDQVKLESGSDLANLDQLDQKLWVALACPTRGVEFDPRTLDLIDTDKDGRIRVPEVIAATKWATGLLKNPDDLISGSASLPLAAINDSTAEGKQIVASAKQILTNLGKPEATAIELADAIDTVKIFAATTFNGDGIVPVEAASDDETKTVMEDIMACMGIEKDRSGKPGVSHAKTDAFFTEAAAYSEWWKKSEGDQNILPLGEGTTSAAAAVKAVKVKVEDFFARCRLAAFDPRALATLNRHESEYAALTAHDLTANASEIVGFPLAQVGAHKALPLVDGVNPAWAESLKALQQAVVKPLLGDKESLNETDWQSILAKLAAFEAWSASKVGGTVEKLGLKRVREILSGNTKSTITALIGRDKALEAEANSIANVEKLVRFHRDLHTFCLNFVSFKNFYARKIPAIFQAGRLYLDQRACDLCLNVEDVGRHGIMAGLAGTYLAYCDCVRKATGEKKQIVAAFTDGDSDNLMVGRNGIFYDRKGNDWDATITKLIDCPISLRQAFWLPYKKLVRMIEEQVAKRAAAADAASTAKMQEAASVTANADKAKAPEAKKVDVGTVAALGVAFGAIFTAIAALATGVLKLALWQVALLPICLMLLISGPSLVLAFIKLRKRNLGPILDANGWAVNSKAKINVPLGKSLTQIATLPEGAQRDLVDPFVEKRKPWGLYLLLIVIFVLGLSWYRGKIDRFLPGNAKSTSVLGTNAPAYNAPTNTIVIEVTTNIPPAAPAP